jgi:hypothetical protein
MRRRPATTSFKEGFMVPDKDYYADKDGKLTDDPEKFAIQVATAGHELDQRVAKRYGISDLLVPTGEPHAHRRVTGHNEASVKIERADDESASTTTNEQPQEPAEAVDEKAAAEEPKVTKAAADKPAAKKGEKKK